MAKRKIKALIDGDSNNDLTSDSNSEFLNLANNKNRRAISDSDSDSESNNNSKKPKRESSDSEPENKEDAKDAKDPEKGEMSNSTKSDEEYNDGYDDQLMGDEEDRVWLALAILIEEERETEIFKRIEPRELMKRRFEIKKKLTQTKKAERAREKLHKHKDLNHIKLQTEFSSIDQKERSKDKKKNIEENRGRVDKRVNAMAELKARREDRKKREEAEETRKEEERKKEKEDAIRSTNKNAVKLEASDNYSDDGENEGGKSSPQPTRQSVGSVRSRSTSSSSENEQEEVEKPAYVPTRVDMNNIRLSRHLLEQFIHLPFFERIVKGCYVKICFGQHNNLLVYRVVEIINVLETANIYNLGNTRTNKSLRVRYGTQVCAIRFGFISNQEFTDTEFHKWIEISTAASNPLPTKEHIEQKQADIKQAINYGLNEKDIERIIREKRRFKLNPYNYAMRKTQLMTERDSAMARGDEEIARELTQKLSHLDERASELDKMRTSTISSISYINYSNKKRNVDEAEKAIMAKVKANKGKEIDDPFKRRSTRPRMNFKAESGDKPAQVTKDDLFSAHDFDIKIDLDLPRPRKIILNDNRASVNLTPRTVTKDLAPRQIVNLQDYKKE